MPESKLPDRKTMHQALAEKDLSLEGIFIVGVKTTGIFCRPGCPARLPKIENTEYFPNTKEALAHGYRPCKVCHPMEQSGEPPSWLRPILDEVDQDPSLRLRDYEIRERGVDPARIRRWFKKTTGFVPSKSGEKNIVTVTRILSPLGPLFAGATEDGICLLEFSDRRMLETQIKRLKKYLDAEFVPGKNKHFKALDSQLREYFEGARQQFDLPLVIPGTDFQKEAWVALQEIPYGETRSYGEQARAVGNSKAVRAVAKANGDNRIGIIIPCHRVIAADGTLAGYGGGLWRKRFLLELESGRSFTD